MQVRRVLALGSIAGSLVAGCFDPAPSMPTSLTSVGPESTGDGDPTGSISVSSASGSASSVETTGLTDSSDDGVPMSCGDGALNGDETDVDCGGTCPPCEDGGDCVDPEDCVS